MLNRKLQHKSGLLFGGIMLVSSAAFAGGTIDLGNDKSISIGMGLRTAFTAVSDAAPGGNAYAKNFALQNARVYISGKLNKEYKFTFNTEEIFGNYGVLEAIVQYEPSKAFNVWMGRMLTPADRIEMNGPFYGLSWNQYTVPLYPSDQGGAAGFYGRDDGITVWGTVNKFQYAVGVFDGYNGPANANDNLLYAGRFAFNFLNMEDNPAYYTSSTYFGGLGDVLTVALSVQQQSTGAGISGDAADYVGAAVDVLFEKVLGGGNVVTLEGEYKKMNTNLSAAALANPASFNLFDGSSYFATAAFLMGKSMGKGKFQPYVRYTNNETSANVSSSLAELGVNYIISGHNLKFNLNATSGDANLTGSPGADATSVSLGMQQQF